MKEGEQLKGETIRRKDRINMEVNPYSERRMMCHGER